MTETERQAMESRTLNRFCVGGRGDRITVLRLAREFEPDDALNLAAWLVACTGRRDEFDVILDAIERS